MREREPESGRNELSGGHPAGGGVRQAMEWKEQADPDHVLAFRDAQRWLEEVTGKSFGNKDFRSALEDGVLLCELVNKIKPGVTKKINRLSTPIAGLDNINVFLKGCQKLGLKEAQLFHPGDLQDLSSRVTVKLEENQRRLKNVLITIYWLGRRAQHEPHYNGPYLNLKAFEGLLGQTLTKALVDSGSLKRSGRDSGYCDIWCTERNESISPQRRHRRDDSLDSLDSLGSKSIASLSSDITLKGSSEGGGSDVESDYLNNKTMDGAKNDMSLRRTSTSECKPVVPYNQFLPTKSKPATYVPAPLKKKRAERHEDNRRSWASPVFTENDGTFSRSKSLNDVSEESTGIPKSLRYEELQKMKAALKDQDQQWQSDLAKWKNRRKSYTSDLQRKKDEREEIEKITSGENARPTKTFKQMREERELRQEGSYGGDQTDYRKLNSSDEEVFAEETKPPRRFYAKSATVASEAPFTSQRNEVVSSAPLAQASRSKTSELKSTDNDQSGKQSSAPYARHAMDRKTESTKVSNSLPRNYQAPDVSRIGPVVVPRPYGTQSKRLSSLTRSYPLQDESLKYNGDANGLKTSHGAPSFFSKPEAQEYKSSGGVLPKKEEGVTWVNTSWKMEEKRSVPVNLTSKSENDAYARSNLLPKQEEDDQSQASSVMSSNEEEEEEEQERAPSLIKNNFPQESKPDTTTGPVTMNSFTKTSSLPTALVTTAATQQGQYGNTRIVINQRPNSDRDFGFTTIWNSTGISVKSVERGGPAEFCQLQVGDEIISVNGNAVADMSHQAWMDAIEGANQSGNLNMEIRRYENSLAPCRSNTYVPITRRERSCISETEYANFNEPTRWDDAGLITVTNKSQSLNRSMEVDKSKREQENLLEDEKPKAFEPLSLRNFKRRSQFFEQGGSESAMNDLQIPSISVSSRWSWNPEEERKRQEIWQKEQDRLLQEKYQREQEKLQEEWRKAQKEAEQEGSKYYEEERRMLQETSTPQSPSNTVDGPVEFKPQYTSRNWITSWNNQESEDESQELGDVEDWHRSDDDEARQREELRLQEERRRQEEAADCLEQERKLHEKERERQEQWHREQERLKEEKRQRQHAEQRTWLAETERTEEYQPQWAKSKSTSDLDERMPAQGHDVGVKPVGGVAQWLLEEENLRRRHGKTQEATRVELETERLKILNQMKYADPERGDVKSKAPDNSWIKSEMRSKSSQQKEPPLSYAEQERQKILLEMRRKTQLLNDNSWIRQRSASVATKTAPSNYGSMRRGESLDNLDAPNANNWGLTTEPAHSSGKGSSYYPVSTSNRSYLRTASSTLPPQSTGSLRTASWTKNPSVAPTSQPQIPSNSQSPFCSVSRSISGKKICSYCDSPLGRGAAMIIESLGLCYHLHCFKCISCGIDLGGTESGAEVRVRNNRLYCNACYIQFKAGQSVPI
ncbi:LIM domain only protein 7 isoform X4 [Stegostoma tigrinum]|uniref:LIM domain only protein 7 isoform X4 n=1 Tax=Stegostoma tigrinum TaxID=3053191 RepID=UPI00202B5AA2|nr:LIM domain only protein 7 isoform X4 [Stegostoma tigrinum]